MEVLGSVRIAAPGNREREREREGRLSTTVFLPKANESANNLVIAAVSYGRSQWPPSGTIKLREHHSAHGFWLIRRWAGRFFLSLVVHGKEQ